MACLIVWAFTPLLKLVFGQLAEIAVFGTQHNRQLDNDTRMRNPRDRNAAIGFSPTFPKCKS
jgi:hypothetical protein